MKTGSETSTAKKLKKSKSGSLLYVKKEISPIFQKRINAERKRAFVTGFFINLFLIFYFLFAAYFLAAEVSEAIEVEQSVLGFCALFSVLASFLWTKKASSIGRSLVERTSPVLKTIRVPSSQVWYKSFSGLFTVSLIAVTAVLGWQITEMSLYDLFSSQGLGGAKRIFVSIFTPELSILPVVLKAMVQTIFIALMATFISIPVAFVTSFLCARNLMRGGRVSMAVYNSLRVIFNFTRSVEPLIWAIIFSVWVGIGPFAGMLALMLHSVAALAKLYSEQIESIDRGPMEAIEATGANPVQVIWYAVVPQIILPYLSFTIYRWDINIRMATIIGLVGGGGVGTLLMQYQGLARWHHVGTIVIVIAIVVWVMDYLSAKIREAIY